MGGQEDIDAGLTLGALGLEMGVRFDIIAAAAVFEAVQEWPLSDVMPVKRTLETASGDVTEVGFIRRGDGPLVLASGDAIPIGYATFETMAQDGWRPD